MSLEEAREKLILGCAEEYRSFEKNLLPDTYDENGKLVYSGDKMRSLYTNMNDLNAFITKREYELNRKRAQLKGMATRLRNKAPDENLGYDEEWLRRQNAALNGFEGVTVKKVAPGSLADKVGIRKGDRFTSIRVVTNLEADEQLLKSQLEKADTKAKQLERKIGGIQAKLEADPENAELTQLIKRHTAALKVERRTSESIRAGFERLQSDPYQVDEVWSASLSSRNNPNDFIETLRKYLFPDVDEIKDKIRKTNDKIAALQEEQKKTGDKNIAGRIQKAENIREGLFKEFDFAVWSDVEVTVQRGEESHDLNFSHPEESKGLGISLRQSYANTLKRAKGVAKGIYHRIMEMQKHIEAAMMEQSRRRSESAEAGSDLDKTKASLHAMKVNLVASNKSEQSKIAYALNSGWLYPSDPSKGVRLINKLHGIDKALKVNRSKIKKFLKSPQEKPEQKGFSKVKEYPTGRPVEAPGKVAPYDDKNIVAYNVYFVQDREAPEGEGFKLKDLSAIRRDETLASKCTDFDHELGEIIELAQGSKGDARLTWPNDYDDLEPEFSKYESTGRILIEKFGDRSRLNNIFNLMAGDWWYIDDFEVVTDPRNWQTYD